LAAESIVEEVGSRGDDALVDEELLTIIWRPQQDLDKGSSNEAGSRDQFSAVHEGMS
jgi:hypothetical protein